MLVISFFFSSRRRHTRLVSDWSSDVCSSDLLPMRLKSRITEVLLAFLSIISPAIAFAQVNPTSPAPQRESIQELLNRLTPQQKQQSDNAGKSYKENQFVEAFAIDKRLLTQLAV